MASQEDLGAANYSSLSLLDVSKERQVPGGCWAEDSIVLRREEGELCRSVSRRHKPPSIHKGFAGTSRCKNCADSTRTMGIQRGWVLRSAEQRRCGQNEICSHKHPDFL